MAAVIRLASRKEQVLAGVVRLRAAGKSTRRTLATAERTSQKGLLALPQAQLAWANRDVCPASSARRYITGVVS